MLRRVRHRVELGAEIYKWVAGWREDRIGMEGE